AGPGAASTTWSSRRSPGSRGTTRTACSSRSVTCRRGSSRSGSTRSSMRPRWRYSRNRVSGEPGAVQCGGSKIHHIGISEPPGHPVRSVAITPDDALGRAIGDQLTKQGYTVADPQHIAAVLAKRNAGALEFMTPEVFAALRDSGVDAVVAVDA